jgi:ABC-type nitrate/sulfonate/bicarbonate transport system ATPase subunit/ABC-type nitrate/sulfonate/bicarbonate transport system permease component
MIAVENLWKAFYDERRGTTVVAIENVSFEIPQGQFVCIVGPSGCGKSTLIRILAGLERATAGRIDTGAGGARRPPAMVFQEASLFPWLTVADNVAYPLRLQGVGKTARDERTQPLLTMTNLGGFSHAYPHQLSGGMKQRASVARALIDDTGDLLLMDEPFGALDEQTRIGLQQELLRIWEQSKKTVIFITHSVEEALSLADRVLVMSARPGQIVADIEVPFPRPRDVLALRREPAFGELTFKVWQLLKHDESAADIAVRGLPPTATPTARITVPERSSAGALDPASLAALVKPPARDKILQVAGMFSPLLVLLVWEALTRSGALDFRFFPAPSAIFETFWELVTSGTLLTDALATVGRVAIGFAMGAIPALALGLALGLWRLPRQILNPIFSALYPVPKIAIFPLLLLLLGVGEMSKYVIIAVVAFFLVFFNTLTGVLQIPRIYLDVAKNAGASELQLFRTVAWPAALPGIFTGLRLAIGTAFVVIAAVEFVGAKSGLGYAIWSAWQTFAVEKMYVGIVAISAVGYLSILLIDLVERLTMPWVRR